MHELLRTSILDAAWDAAAKTDWNNVRVVDIAETVGVSRQTIYNEFGTKEDLAQALFNREVEMSSSAWPPRSTAPTVCPRPLVAP